MNDANTTACPAHRHNGYLGAVMAPCFQQAGHQVVGLDTGYFRQCTLVPDPVDVPSISKDIRDLVVQDLGASMPSCTCRTEQRSHRNLNDRWTRRSTSGFSAAGGAGEGCRGAAVPLLIVVHHVRRVGGGRCHRDSPLDPADGVRPFEGRGRARHRRPGARGLLPDVPAQRHGLRLSPRMRFDTVLNDLVGSAVTTGEIRVLSDGKPWRPVVHIQDVARAFLTVLEAPVDAVHNEAFNTGAEELNQQIITLAQIAARRSRLPSGGTRRRAPISALTAPTSASSVEPSPVSASSGRRRGAHTSCAMPSGRSG